VPLPPLTEKIAPSHGTRALPGLLMALKGSRNQGVPTGYILRQLFIVLLPALLFVFVALWSYRSVTTVVVEEVSTMTRIGDTASATSKPQEGGLPEPPSDDGVKEPPGAGGVQEPPGSEGVKEPPGAEAVKEPPGSEGVKEPPSSDGVKEPPGSTSVTADGSPAPAQHVPASKGYWIGVAAGAAALALFYALLSFTGWKSSRCC
jgi:hypothetical protein